MLGADLPPAVPAQHRGPVEEDDLLHLRNRAGLQEHLRPGPHRVKRRRGAGFQSPGGDALGELYLDLHVDRLEQLALALEVVVEGAAGDARGTDDLLGADPRVAAHGEQRPRGGDQGAPGRLRALGLGAAGYRLAGIHVIHVHSR